MQAQPHPFAQGNKIVKVKKKMPGKLWAALKWPSGGPPLLTAISALTRVQTAASQGLGWWQEL